MNLDPFVLSAWISDVFMSLHPFEVRINYLSSRPRSTTDLTYIPGRQWSRIADPSVHTAAPRRPPTTLRPPAPQKPVHVAHQLGTFRAPAAAAVKLTLLWFWFWF